MTTATTAHLTRRLGTVAHGALAVLYAAFTGLASFGIPSLLTAWTTAGPELELRTAYVYWGVLAGLFIPVAALALLRRALVAPATMLLGLIVSIGCTLAIALEPENAQYAAMTGIPALLLVLFHPQRGSLLQAGAAGMDRLLTGLVAVAAVPAVLLALDHARNSAATPYTDTMHGQYAQGSIIVLALLCSGAVTALRQSGWVVAAVVTVAGTALIGVAGIVFPNDLMSVGRPWGIACVVLAACFAGASLGARRR
ncbi:hypothetical protein [Micromonospora sp. DT47]|uniref:hypothetical protein n=1 Tax=Micromonospora sp. DT47 TaxID=3393431 RepID=UPI003CEEF0BA